MSKISKTGGAPDGRTSGIHKTHQRPILSTHPKSLFLLGHITWCQKFFWWRSFLWSFHGICRFASFYCCLNSNVIQDSCRFKATDLPHPYLCVFFFIFRITFVRKKVLEVHYKNLKESVILCLENYHVILLDNLAIWYEEPTH